MLNVNIIASLCSLAGRVESYLVDTLKTGFCRVEVNSNMIGFNKKGIPLMVKFSIWIYYITEWTIVAYASL